MPQRTGFLPRIIKVPFWNLRLKATLPACTGSGVAVETIASEAGTVTDASWWLTASFSESLDGEATAGSGPTRIGPAKAMLAVYRLPFEFYKFARFTGRNLFPNRDCSL